MWAQTPKRHWLRPRNVVLVCIGALFIIVGWIVWEIVALMYAQPHPVADYRGAFLRDARQAAGISEGNERGSGWTEALIMLEEASQILNTLDHDLRAANPPARWSGDTPNVDFMYVTSGTAVPADADRERDAIERLQAAGIFDDLAETAERSPILDGPSLTGPWIEARMPELAQSRRLAIARNASMRLALTAGDFDEVVRAFDQTLALAETMSWRTPLISYLVGIAIANSAIQELQYELTESEFDAKSCRAFLASLEQRSPPGSSHALEGERAHSHDTVQWYFSGEGDGNGYLIPGNLSSGDPRIVQAFMARFFVADRVASTRFIDECFDEFIAEAKLLPVERWRKTSGDVRSRIDEALNSRRFQLMAHFMPAVQKSIDSEAHFRVLYEGTRVMVGIEVYRALHGEYPASLDELEGDVFEIVPGDPLHDKPFCYKRLATPDAHGREYLLYSSGYDGSDDGGHEITSAEHRNGERAAIVDRETTGVDFVLNRPRPPLGK